MGCCQKKPEQGPRVVSFGRQRNRNRYESNAVHTTKYNWFTFLPKSIILQFIRPANTFYLVVAILQCITVISALNPVASVAPFIVVILVSIVREGYQDNKRRKNDKETNETKTHRLSNQRFVECMWQDIQVGDFVKVMNDELIPADMVLLFSSEENGICYVETANLDGERNLKTKTTPTDDLRLVPENYERAVANVSCQQPNKNLHEFQGVLQLEGRPPKPLSEQNLLLRGTMLKNTDEVVGLVVYAGMKSKIVMNSAGVRHKTSAVEKKVNKIQLFLFLVLALMILTASLMHYRVFHSYSTRDNIFYLRSSHHWSVTKDAALISLTVFLLLAFLIPISMNISMEVLKTIQGDLIGKDIEMSMVMTEKNKREYVRVQNTSIIEELGSVEYVLSDKTGTLTSNEMVFKNIWVEGTQYSAEDTIKNKERLLNDSNFLRFWTSVVLCHQVVVDTRKHQYQGSSADEVCFLEHAKFLGFVFRKRTRVSIEVEIINQKKVYELLLLLPFSDRKMMTVIVKDVDAQAIVVLTKGADSAVLAAASKKQSAQKLASLKSALDKFSKMGLRTLVFGLRTIPNQQFSMILQEYNTFLQQKVSAGMSKEQEKVKYREIVGKLQQDLTLIGVSAIEDKLQDGVPETIERLQQAGIKVVMITGDKLETAENIGMLSNFIHQNSKIYRIGHDVQNFRAEITKIRRQIPQGTTPGEFSILIEGNAIQKIIECEDKEFITMFASVVTQCKSLIFCRSTPSQKGSIVKFFKKNFKKTVLAIGDGGNDVNMIQQADIGVGLMGKEGNQASSASDFSLCQFRFLDRLLMQHGRWAYYRIAYFFVYYGFKNMLITFILFYFLAYSGWSGTNILTSAYLTCYNSLISVFLTIYYGVLQQDINCDMYTPAYPIMPYFYKQYKKIQLFSYFRYFLWSIGSIICSVWIYFTTVYGLGLDRPCDSAGRVGDMRSLSSNLSLSSFLAITVVAYLDMYNFTYFSWIIFGVLTLLLALLYFIIQNFAQVSPNYYSWSDHFNLNYWLVMLINVAVVLAVRVAYNTLRFNVWSSLVREWMIKRNRDYAIMSRADAITGTLTQLPQQMETTHRLQEPPGRPQPVPNNGYDNGTIYQSHAVTRTKTTPTVSSTSPSSNDGYRHTRSRNVSNFQQPFNLRADNFGRVAPFAAPAPSPHPYQQQQRTISPLQYPAPIPQQALQQYHPQYPQYPQQYPQMYPPQYPQYPQQYPSYSQQYINNYPSIPSPSYTMQYIPPTPPSIPRRQYHY